MTMTNVLVSSCHNWQVFFNQFQIWVMSILIEIAGKKDRKKNMTCYNVMTWYFFMQVRGLTPTCDT